MRTLADRLALPMDEYTNMVSTIYGGEETLPTQSPAHLRKRQPFTGCNAGHAFFHVDPFGRASICKVGCEPNIDLLGESLDGLSRLGGTCLPLVQLYRKAKAPLIAYCQHRETPRKEEATR